MIRSDRDPHQMCPFVGSLETCRSRDCKFVDMGIPVDDAIWPSLPLDSWRPTYETLHRWMQVVGKIPGALATPLNHWWHVAFHGTARGLSTHPIPWRNEIFTLEFDFIDHSLRIRTSRGERRSIALVPKATALFQAEVMASLHSLGIQVALNPKYQEMADPVPFDQDFSHSSYDPEAVHRFWRILVQSERVFNLFRAEFIGKCSPVHFFWGSFDLTVTRFSGRIAPPRAGADAITREAYSHEVSSCGFWPGGGAVSGPAFYSYAAPEPEGFAQTSLEAVRGNYRPDLHEFVLMYDDVRTAKNPDSEILAFCRATYRAAADLGGWDRAALERRLLGNNLRSVA